MKYTLLLLCLLFSFSSYSQSCKPNFSTSVGSNLNLTITRTSNWPSGPNSPFYTIRWGDGTSSNSYYGGGSHTYSTWGNYSVTLVCTILDSSNNNTLHCIDSTTKIVSVGGCKPAFNLSKSGSFGVNMYITSGNPFSGTINNLPFYTIYWGDGTQNTGYNYFSNYHTYTKPGNYSVKLVCTLLDSNNNNTLYCKDSLTKMYVQGGCGNASFTNTNNGGLSVKFYNFSSNLTGKTKDYSWDFGDGSTSTSLAPTHIYNSTGTYSVKLITTWKTSPNNIYCVDTVVKNVVVSTTSNNKVTGYILRADTLILPINPSYKVWLIKYDSSTQILSAVDSTIVQTVGNSSYTGYQFNNVTVGKYRVKAAVHNGPTTGTGYVPTYGQSALMWNNADSITHHGGLTQQHINMKQGSLTSGPGFVGGSVLQGANKGTNSGISGINVFLLNSNGDVIQHSITNGQGKYSFDKIPLGNYSIYPENLGDITTPATASISSTKTKFEDISFERSTKNKTIVPKPTTISNITPANELFSVYPNPAHDVIYVDWKTSTNKSAQVTLTDITGKIVYSTETMQNNKLTINTQEFSTGAYILHVKSSNITTTQKVTIQ